MKITIQLQRSKKRQLIFVASKQAERYEINEYKRTRSGRETDEWHASSFCSPLVQTKNKGLPESINKGNNNTNTKHDKNLIKWKR